jgi:lipopolysaccharide assembly outer membrane protein LptD (OstA)
MFFRTAGVRFLISQRLIVCLFFLSFLFSPFLQAAESDAENKIEAVADNLQYLQNEKKLVGKGNVVVTYGNIELTADEAEINTETEEAHAKGHVVVRSSAQGALSGDEVFFNFRTSSGRFPDGRIFQWPWYGLAKELEQKNSGKVVAYDVYISSCDLPNPHYDVKAKEAIILFEDKIIAKNVIFRILGQPVFWWPYLVIPLNKNGPITIVPGYSSEYGAFVLASKGIAVSKQVYGRILFDWYSKRGFGAGAEFEYKFDRLGTGDIKIYGINDQDAPDDRKSDPFEDENKRDKDRGRASWRHKARIDPFTTVHLNWHELSDDRFMQDFFEREHREEIDPQSFFTVTRNTERYSLLTHVEKRANRFQTVSEKLPEVVYTWLRRPLFDTNFYYTHETGFVNFNQTKAFSSDGPNTVQVFTDQELSYPLRFFKYYNFNPFVNFREDYFTKSREKESGTSRYVIGTGFDMSTRFYKTWDVQKNFFGIKINQLRHVIEPIIQYNSIKFASVDPSKLIVTGRGDQLDHQDVITLGIENRLQTKRVVKGKKNPERVDLVSFNAFLDYSFGPGSDLIRTRANKFTDARFQTVLRPYDWLIVRMDTVYDLIDHNIFTNNTELAFEPGRLMVALSHRYIKNRSHDGRVVSNLEIPIPHLVLDDAGSDNQLTVDLNYDLNERWDIGGYVRWQVNGLNNVVDNLGSSNIDSTDRDSFLEEWEIRAQRDLHDWLLDFGFNVRNSDRTDPDSGTNKEVFVQLRLKALPFVELKTGHRANFSGARLGRSVTGINEAPPPPSYTFTPDAQYASLSGSYA